MTQAGAATVISNPAAMDTVVLDNVPDDVPQMAGAPVAVPVAQAIPASAPVRSGESFFEADAPQETSFDAQHAQTMQLQAASRKRGVPMIAGIAVACVLAIGAMLVGTLAATQGGADGTVGAEEAFADDSVVFVDFNVEAEDGLQDSTPIPIEIEGKDWTGKEVSTKITYHPRTGSVALRPGNYVARIYSPPVSADGRLYRYPEKTYRIDIPRASASDAAGSARSDDSLFGDEESPLAAEGASSSAAASSDAAAEEQGQPSSDAAPSDGAVDDAVINGSDHITVGADDPLTFEVRDDATEEEVAQAQDAIAQADEEMANSQDVFTEEEGRQINEQAQQVLMPEGTSGGTEDGNGADTLQEEQVESSGAPEAGSDVSTEEPTETPADNQAEEQATEPAEGPAEEEAPPSDAAQTNSSATDGALERESETQSLESPSILGDGSTETPSLFGGDSSSTNRLRPDASASDAEASADNPLGSDAEASAPSVTDAGADETNRVSSSPEASERAASSAGESWRPGVSNATSSAASSSSATTSSAATSSASSPATSSSNMDASSDAGSSSGSAASSNTASSRSASSSSSASSGAASSANGASASSSKAPQRKDAAIDKSKLYDAYFKIIQAYQTARVGDEASSNAKIEGILLCQKYLPIDSDKRVYAYCDINGDGIEELLIGVKDADGKDKDAAKSSDDAGQGREVFHLVAADNVSSGTVKTLVMASSKGTPLVFAGGIYLDAPAVGNGVATYWKLEPKTNKPTAVESFTFDGGKVVAYAEGNGKAVACDQAKYDEVAKKYRPLKAVEWRAVADFDAKKDREYLKAHTGSSAADKSASSSSPANKEPAKQEAAPPADDRISRTVAGMEGWWQTGSIGRRTGYVYIHDGVHETFTLDGQSSGVYCTYQPGDFQRFDNGLSGEFNGGPGYFVASAQNGDYGVYVSDEDLDDNGRIDQIIPIRIDGSGYSGGSTLMRVDPPEWA